MLKIWVEPNTIFVSQTYGCCLQLTREEVKASSSPLCLDQQITHQNTLAIQMRNRATTGAGYSAHLITIQQKHTNLKIKTCTNHKLLSSQNFSL